jgi:RNA polymerase sigma factor (sigma-70 family)
VLAAVQALPPQARQAVALRYVADLTDREVAEVMGLAAGTVARTLHDARAALAETLAPTHDEEATRG